MVAIASVAAFVLVQGEPLPACKQPVRALTEVRASDILSKAKPVFPASARNAGVSGQVILNATVGPDGHVSCANVVSGTAEFVDAARAAVQQWIYKPYLVNGQPTEFGTMVVFNFQIESSGPQGSPTQTGFFSDALPELPPEALRGALLRKVPPDYPADAKRQHVSGAVHLKVTIDEQGRVVGLDVVDGPDLLRDAAMEAARQWVYRPYLRNGSPTAFRTVLTINFAFYE